MKVYKLVRKLSDGNLYPLFIDKHKPFKFGNWMKAEFHPTKGFAPRSLGIDDEGEKLGGWHCCYRPYAPHLSEKLATGEQRVWIECESQGVAKSYDRPESQGGAWILVEWLKPLREMSYSEVHVIQRKYLEESKCSM